jgi:hypothetical protein
MDRQYPLWTKGTTWIVMPGNEDSGRCIFRCRVFADRLFQRVLQEWVDFAYQATFGANPVRKVLSLQIAPISSKCSSSQLTATWEPSTNEWLQNFHPHPCTIWCHLWFSKMPFTSDDMTGSKRTVSRRFLTCLIAGLGTRRYNVGCLGRTYGFQWRGSNAPMLGARLGSTAMSP